MSNEEKPTTDYASSSTTTHHHHHAAQDSHATGNKYAYFIPIVISVLVSAIVPQIVPHLNLPRSPAPTSTTVTAPPPRDAPLYWIFQKGTSEAHLKHVKAVLERVGIARTHDNATDDWDLLWSHDYPFRALYPHLHRLRAHQRVNHFPGTGFLTNKVNLATTANLPYVPAAFKLPAERQALLDYAADRPQVRFVQKHNQHRHIYVRNVTAIDYADGDSFVQVFRDDPYLVDGHKFDMGVYVTITSVAPLRLYMYAGDVLFRYCALPYHPFDAAQPDKYVVGDDYMPTWEVPSLRRAYTQLGYGMRAAFDAYVRSRGDRPERIWQQVEEAVRLAVLAKEKHIVEALKAYPQKRTFFEMMRFDLGVDANLNVFLMEANMSPNLSSAHFVQNQLLYEQVLYNLMRLVGVASPVNRTTFRRGSSSVQEMLSASKNIMVNADACTTVPCTQSCADVQCQLCLPCLSDEDLQDLHDSYAEHMRKGDQKRLFPNTADDVETIRASNMTRKNQLLSTWFRLKCEEDSTWCS